MKKISISLALATAILASGTGFGQNTKPVSSAAQKSSAVKQKPKSASAKKKKADPKFLAEVQTYLDEYNTTYRKLYTASSEAAWNVNTHIVEGDKTNAKAAQAADEAMAAFTGSTVNIEKARKYLEKRAVLTPLQVKQLEKILYAAAASPQNKADVVKRRIRMETAQTEALFGFKYTLNGKKVSTNQIDSILGAETNLDKRRQAWEASKEVGKVLKDSLAELRNLRNSVVQGLGYPDYFTYQVSDYGMSTPEMMALNRKFLQELWPLYRELHTYARYELAKKYNASVPALLPAHWLPNRWAQDWSSMVHVKGLNTDSIILAKWTKEKLVQQGEAFYKSLGFPALPSTFYERSSLYPLPANAPYSKNNHASAWHMDLDKDVRSLMSVEPNTEWYSTVNHELGHIYYYMSYSNPMVPYLLREGANRAYHEAFGTMIGMVAMQKAFLAQNGLLPPGAKTDETQELLKQALEFVVFIPFSAGTMTEFEHDMYVKNLPKDQFNARWWELTRKYQGVEPPSVRGEQYCDAASKTHINDDPAQYYDYAMSFILLFQIHDHISKNILHQDPHNANYYNSKAVGEFLQDIMKWGASKDWRKVLKEKTGSELSAKPMLDYFAPLMVYLKEQNKGRTYTLPEKVLE